MPRLHPVRFTIPWCCALFLLLLSFVCSAAPVSLPYTNDFAVGAGSFTPANNSGTSWSATGGAYRCTMTSTSASGSASIQAAQLGGDPLTSHDFFLSGKFTVVANGNSGNTFGFALFGTDANFTGGVNQPYYLIDVKPPQNSLRVLRIGINNTSFIPDTTLPGMTLNASQPFTLEVLGTYEHGVLRMDVTVRQGASSATLIAVDSEPLTTSYFGFRHHTNGGTLTVDCDDFVLRRIANDTFTQTPAPFARSGVPYSAQVAATSSTGAAVTLTAPALPAWMHYTAGLDGTGTLSGTPTATDLGSHMVTLAASDAESGSAQQSFHVSVLEPTGVFISEFLAENDAGLEDEDGDQPDWIELFNSDSTPADIGGWWLSDDPLMPKKWAFPVGTTLPAQGFLVVFASGKNRTADPAHLHTNFKLANDAGAHLSLARPDGSVVSVYANYPKQRADRSYGTYGSYTTRGYLVTPTPGMPNDAIGYAGFVADTQFSVGRGFYTSPQDVTVTCATPGATLVYTLNGSTPSPTNGTQATSPLALHIASTTVLRVAAFAANLVPSGPDTQSYLFLEDVRTQSASGAAPSGWPSGKVNGQVLNYGMDPDITSSVSAQQMKDALAALPSLSLVTDLPNLFDASKGIYVNPYGREEGYECPVSVELLNADNAPGFHVNAGLRIRGGASRVATNPKHNFHLYFRSEYGASKLKYPLFGDEGTDEFDRVDLRSTQGKSWHLSNDSSATYNRDEWNRYTQAAMGDAYTRGRYYHLYIDGQYWGIYSTEERADSAYTSSYFGGKKADYDVMKTYVIPHRVEASDGDNVAWSQLFQSATAGFSSDAAYYAVQGRDPTGQPSATIKPLVDIDNLIDYTLLHYYAGNGDGPINSSVGVPKNFYAFRPRDGRFGFRFVAHDCEDTMNTTDVSGTTSVGSTLLYFNPRWLSQRLESNPKYRLRFADRAQRHLFNGGPLDTPVAVSRWQGFRAELSTAILAESARWGDAAGGSPHTVAQWTNANNSIENSFIPNRRATIISQLRARSLFPSIDAPAFSQHGGNITAGYSLAITAPTGTTIYYTLDGTDPQAAGANVYSAPFTLSGVQVRVQARARKNSTGEWSALTDALFTIGTEAAAAGKIAISEIHYNPPGSGDDTEFVELLNISPDRLDLSGANFTGAMIFTFGNIVLEPGARICVVENVAAFAAAYGSSPMVAGQWTGALNNGGDTIILRDKNGDEIERVAYGTDRDWPPAADGGGASLVRIDPFAPADTAANWRTSTEDGGNPGGTDTVLLAAWLSSHGFASALDIASDGLPALLHFACGTDLSGQPGPALAIVLDTATQPSTALVTFRRRLAADQIQLQLQTSADLNTWQTLIPGSLDAPIVSRLSHGDGTESLTIRIGSIADRQFVRLKAVVR